MESTSTDTTPTPPQTGRFWTGIQKHKDEQNNYHQISVIKTIKIMKIRIYNWEKVFRTNKRIIIEICMFHLIRYIQKDLVYRISNN